VSTTTLADPGLSPADLFGAFPSPDLAGVAAASFPAAAPDLREGPSFSVEVSPGCVALAARDLARAERAHNRRAEAPVILPAKGRAGREVTAWSRKSRANMVRQMAAADWGPVFGSSVPVMVTLTYPGEWESVAPDGETVKRHLDNFRRAWFHRWGSPLVGAWKLEFQRRGAPHFHLMVPTPPVPPAEFRSWVSAVWARIVGHSDPVQYANHLMAGTGIDYANGARMRDPRRVAVYFLKHGTKTHDGKEYQNAVPEQWQAPGKGPGRFWGLWGVRVESARVFLSPADFVNLRRLLRRWSRANNRNLFIRGRLQGGWVAVNDGPAFAFTLSRALALLESP